MKPGASLPCEPCWLQKRVLLFWAHALCTTPYVNVTLHISTPRRDSRSLRDNVVYWKTKRKIKYDLHRSLDATTTERAYPKCTGERHSHAYILPLQTVGTHTGMSAFNTRTVTTMTDLFFHSAIESDIAVRLRNHNNMPAQDCPQNFNLVASSAHYSKCQPRSIPKV